MKAILIDATSREVREVEYQGTKDLNRLLGGWIECAWHWGDTGDTLYVDEEGLNKPASASFRLSLRTDQPFAGNGVVVGREMLDKHGDYVGTADPAISVVDLRSMVEFIDRGQMLAWGFGHRDRPAVMLTGSDGKTEVLATYGDMPIFDASDTANVTIAHLSTMDDVDLRELRDACEGLLAVRMSDHVGTMSRDIYALANAEIARRIGR